MSLLGIPLAPESLGKPHTLGGFSAAASLVVSVPSAAVKPLKESDDVPMDLVDPVVVRTRRGSWGTGEMPPGRILLAGIGALR